MLENCVPWPDETADAYREAGYWTDEVLGRWPADDPGRAARCALVTAERTLTYAELDRAAERRAAGLLDRGIGRDDRVIVQLPNDIDLVVCTLALLRIGALPVFALPAHRTMEIVDLVEVSGARAYVGADVVLGHDFRLMATEVRSRCSTLTEVFIAGEPGDFTALAEVDAEPRTTPPPEPGDVAMFLLSGGTTGKPKLIPRTHADYAYQLRASAEVCDVGPHSRLLAALPVGHNFPLGCPGVLGVLRAGGVAVLSPSPSPDDCFSLIESAGVTITSLVPPMVPLWLEAAEWMPEDLSSLQVLQVGGARLDPVTAGRVREGLDCRLQQVYGMAEGLLNFTRLDDPQDLVLTTQGRPLSPGDEIRIVGPDGAEVGTGEPGELLTRGPYTFRGYYRAPGFNRVRFTGDGFFRTGDVVLSRPTGHLEVVGRINDVVNRGGEKVPAQELEELLMTMPAVAGAAVVAVPDPDMGELTCACIVPRGAEHPPALQEIRSALTERGVAGFKLPDRLVVFDRLPVTAVGKIDKKTLTARAVAQLIGGGAR
ncbi:(2,3-dihydroxybenzoyl)adenylate synthase [Micromonospora sp. WMMD723]|uniref:(2,3-dihydroxybenzoyl)adenylate synthase n=1 Tax=Micromonospora sp. WMMD723 TaxID=3403465 RepID=UPI003CEFE6DA